MSKYGPVDQKGFLRRIEGNVPFDGPFEGNVIELRPEVRHAFVAAHPDAARRPAQAAAGLGGGLRLSDMYLEADAPVKVLERPVSLTRNRILRALACCGIIGALAIGHVQLRFLINDARLQHQRMQHVHRDLIQDYAMLDRTTTQLSDYNRLHDFATQQLHMVEVQDRPVAYISHDLRQKYSGDSVAQAHAYLAQPRAVAKFGELRTEAKNKLLKLVDTGRAAFSGEAAR
jgi:hypothetical protein